ncbi:MAG: SIS domain-containing protein [Saccharofermentanales bacterium]
MYYSYDEIFRQGSILRKTYDAVIADSGRIKEFFNSGYEEIVFIACGSSYWLSMSACMTFQIKSNHKCFAVKSGDIVMNPDYYLESFRKPLVIVPSRSGSTTETLMAVKLFREHFGCKVLSMVEYPDTSIAQVSDLVLEFPWAAETSICQTRSFSNLYMASVMLAALTGNDETLLDDIRQYLDQSDIISSLAESRISQILSEFPQYANLITLGNGRQYGVCIEGAYISIEMTQLHSNYYGVLEFRHGPIVMADPSYLVVFFSGGNGREYEEEMAMQVRAKGSKVAVICAAGDFRNADHVFSLGREASPEVTALYGIMVMQGFAHLKAVELGIDPDKPKDLVSWIEL